MADLGRTSGDVVINGRFLTQRLTGVQRFAIETVRAMDRLLEMDSYSGLRMEILVPRGGHRDLSLRNIAVRPCGRTRGYLWEQLELPLQIGRRLLVSLCALGPLFTHRQLLVVHDTTFLAEPRSFTFATRTLYQILVPALVARCKGLVAVSEFTRDEMVKRLGSAPGRITVCSEGGDHVLRIPADSAVLDRLSLRGRPFFLAVGVGGRNKNLPALLAGFTASALSDATLLITGKRNPRVHPEARDFDAERVRYTGYVSDSELRALYEHAVALVYPSTYEGFGLPPLEAMTCGCPVIGSHQPALLEVSSGCAMHVDVKNSIELGAAMRRLSQDATLRAELAQKGRARAAQFRWEQTAQVLLGIILAERTER